MYPLFIRESRFLHLDSGYLTPRFGLTDLEKEKACLFVDDLLVLLNNHWVHDTEVCP